MAATVDTSQRFSAEAPTQLFQGAFVLDNAAGGGGNPNYDISADGTFVFVENLSSLDDAGSRQIIVVLNWDKELLERVPIP